MVFHVCTIQRVPNTWGFVQVARTHCALTCSRRHLIKRYQFISNVLCLKEKILAFLAGEEIKQPYGEERLEELLILRKLLVPDPPFWQISLVLESC